MDETPPLLAKVNELERELRKEQEARQNAEEALKTFFLCSPAEDGEEANTTVYTKEQWRTCLKMLWTVVKHPENFDRHMLARISAVLRALFEKVEETEGRESLLLRFVQTKNVSKELRKYAYEKRAEHDHKVLDNTMLRKAYLKHLNDMKETLPPLEDLLAAQAAGGGSHLYLYDKRQVLTLMSSSGEDHILADDKCLATKAEEKEIAEFLETKVLRARKCQICQKEYHKIHFFYGNHFCPDCSLLNWSKRNQTASLEGKVALLTGGRLKIGFEVGLLMLRAGAEVHVTTRFPVDATLRYSKEKDFEEWQGRLFVYRLDMRNIGEVESFCTFMKKKLSRLDIIINNAAQTISRPAGYYHSTIENERFGKITEAQKPILRSNFELQKSLGFTKGSVVRIPPALKSNTGVYPIRTDIGCEDDCTAGASSTNRETTHDDKTARVTNDDEHFVDLSKKNSWMLDIHEVSTRELLEVQAINSIAPFIIISRLLPAMRPELAIGKSVKEEIKTHDPRFIINVSAMEGQFYRHKSGQHPHTNMAKAALNMVTRTCAPDYAAKFGIYINSVDTGWVTDEKPLLQKLTSQEEWTPPLDSKDGACRVMDPIFLGLNERDLTFGMFWKDYTKTHW